MDKGHENCACDAFAGWMKDTGRAAVVDDELRRWITVNGAPPPGTLFDQEAGSAYIKQLEARVARLEETVRAQIRQIGTLLWRKQDWEEFEGVAPPVPSDSSE